MIENKVHRIFIGGLFENVSQQDIRDRFKSFGVVKEVQVVQKKDAEGQAYKTFAYMNICAEEASLKKCFALFGKTKWNGCEMKVQIAKDDFMTRLKKEWSEPEKEKKKKKQKVTKTKNYEDIIDKAKKMKKSVPGTTIEGEKNWVVGKYGRPLPVIYLSKYKNKKHFKVDPSKHCHCLRRINTEDENIKADDLTWELSDKLSTLEKIQNNLLAKQIDSNKIDYKSPSKNISSVKSKYKDNGREEIFEKSTKRKRKLSEEKSSEKQKIMKSSCTDNISDISVADNRNATDKTDDNNEDSLAKKSKTDYKKSEDFLSSTPHNSSRLGSSIIDQLMSLRCNSENSISTQHLPTPVSSVGNNRLGTSIIDQLMDLTSKASRTERNYEIRSENSRSSDKNNDSYESDGMENGHISSSDDEESDTDIENPFDFTLEELKAAQMDKNIKNSNPKLKEFSFVNIPASDSSEESESGSEEDDEISFSSGEKGMEREEQYRESHKNEESEMSDDNDVNDDLTNSVHKNTDSESSSEESNNSRILIDRQNKIAKTSDDKKAEKFIKPIDDAITPKRLHSEEVRLKALKNRQKQMDMQSNLIKSSLKSIDTTTNQKNRIVFESDEENESVGGIENKVEDFIDEKAIFSLKNKKGNVVEKMNLFNDSDDEVEENVFSIKKQFQGEKGEKLFKLQKKIGGDERFRLDERFADSSDEEVATIELNDIEMDAEESLENERESQLSILESVLGKSLSKDKSDSGIKGKTYQRYDPEKEEHKEFEIKRDDGGDNQPNIRLSEDEKEKEQPKNDPPVVSKEVYFQVDSSLKDLFSKPEQKSAGFTFLGESNNDAEENNEYVKDKSIGEIKESKKLNWSKALQEINDKNSDVQSNIAEKESIDDVSTENNLNKKTLFFIDKNENWFAPGKSFKRTESLEVIEEQWKALRPNLVEVYKKKNKDAMRRLKKMKGK